LVDRKDSLVARKNKIQVMLDAYAATFESPAGVLVLKDLRMAFAGVSFDVKSPYQTAFNEGQRAVILKIDALIEEAHSMRKHGPSSDAAGLNDNGMDSSGVEGQPEPSEV